MTQAKEKRIWTIGHSTRSWDEFIELLKINSIDLLVDVRSLPGSNKFPQFNKEHFESDLLKSGISYQHWLILGGRRKVHKDSVNTAWRNDSFRGYADYMETKEFKKGLKDLEKEAATENVCLMCAEAVWWRCHRSMIADVLKLEGWTVLHILSDKKVEEHPYTSAATIKDGKLLYH
ncbi:DUF488 domain-containing protein [Albibacterium indicum]|uniref:DUF488 domain-containing protein n=1 Tax=Albibacterium indicum TaxID=2292082 RepID=UPI000E4FAA00|nr:DUF488 domain-containing protein [Pedobacter indicus]